MHTCRERIRDETLSLSISAIQDCTLYFTYFLLRSQLIVLQAKEDIDVLEVCTLYVAGKVSK